MNPKLADAALDQIFRNARSQNGFLDEPVSDDTLRALHDLMKWGPTAANACPLRIVFIRSAEAKEKLKPALMPANVGKVMSAPITALLGRDLEFHEHLPRLFPHVDAKSWFAGNSAAIDESSRLNAALQAGYLILAARSLGLDCGPMSGFNPADADAAFFAGTQVKSFMLVTLGKGNPAKLFPRSPRFDFAEVCRIV
ncbi:MAG: malonic semialdehyde reductase [Zoogloeaceae bacterium]|jgi:3-hydroxypropanoate dehydrogenase|nr:malonic semialdehyde reductase [Zoogloeaceae bacterium]